MGPPLRNGKEPYRRANEDIRPYGTRGRTLCTPAEVEKRSKKAACSAVQCKKIPLRFTTGGSYCHLPYRTFCKSKII